MYWDSQLPGSGLIIYRVNTTVENGNADGPPDEVYIFRPGGTNNNTNGTINNAFFSSQSGRTELNNTSNPPCFLSNNQPGGISISNISASGGTTMSFDVGAACKNVKNLTVNYTGNCEAQITWSGAKEIILSSAPIETPLEETYTLSEPALSDTRFSSYFSHFDKPESFLSTTKSRDGWLMMCGDNADAVGTGGSVDYIVATRWLPGDLTGFGISNGNTITKVAFIPWYNASFTILIYQGGTSPTNPGSIVHQQVVSQSLALYQYNEITLTNPVAINTSQELWIAYSIVTYGGYPACCDAGPRVPNQGDIMYWGGWTNAWNATQGKTNANWNIAAYIITGNPPEEYKYNIYRDGVRIVSGLTETSYLDSGFSPFEKHTWSVTAVANGNEICTSNNTKESCKVGIDENEKLSFSIFPNPASNDITLTSEKDFHTITIYNLVGQTVIEQFNTGNVAKLNIVNLTKGIYFICLNFDKGKEIKKFVKQ